MLKAKNRSLSLPQLGKRDKHNVISVRFLQLLFLWGEKSFPLLARQAEVRGMPEEADTISRHEEQTWYVGEVCLDYIAG